MYPAGNDHNDSEKKIWFTPTPGFPKHYFPNIFEEIFRNNYSSPSRFLRPLSHCHTPFRSHSRHRKMEFLQLFRTSIPMAQSPPTRRQPRAHQAFLWILRRETTLKVLKETCTACLNDTIVYSNIYAKPNVLARSEDYQPLVDYIFVGCSICINIGN